MSAPSDIEQIAAWFDLQAAKERELLDSDQLRPDALERTQERWLLYRASALSIREQLWRTHAKDTQAQSLIEVLHTAMQRLNASREVSCPGRVHVVIARGVPVDRHSQAYQLRLRHDVDMGLSAYRCESRSWLGEQWSDWREHRGWLGAAGFDIADVLAPDWRIIE